MLHSMTGYGRGEATNGEVTVVVELRSVNNRFRDLQLRCPREYLALESKIHAQLKACVQRGRVDAFVRRSARSSGADVVANLGLAKAYLDSIRTLTASLDPGSELEPPLSFVLQQPGVLETGDAEVDVDAEWDVVQPALAQAIDALVRMRAAEGAALKSELEAFRSTVVALLAEVAEVADGVADRIKVRLLARLERIHAEGIDPQRLAQEVALLADKADVVEEVTRMRSHCEQFGEALDADEPVGRRLDFLLQEMNREVNTIGSKATDHPVSRRVVELKSVLERMREQSANVE